jgi:hypothetical protein
LSSEGSFQGILIRPSPFRTVITAPVHKKVHCSHMSARVAPITLHPTIGNDNFWETRNRLFGQKNSAFKYSVQNTIGPST